MQPKKKQLHLCTCKPYNESSVRICRWYVHLPSVEYIQMSFTIIIFLCIRENGYKISLISVKWLTSSADQEQMYVEEAYRIEV